MTNKENIVNNTEDIKNSTIEDGLTLSEFYFNSSTGINKIYACMVIPEGEVKGVVQIAHGIAEHIHRYLPFMKFLARNGFVAVGNDHLGHGKSTKNSEELGIFAKKNGWNHALSDIDLLYQLTHKKYPNVPYIFFGHSMGSFLIRHYVILHPEQPNLVILCGTGHQNPLLIFSGDLMAKMVVLTSGPDKVSQLLNFLCFGSYNKGIKDLRTSNDWLNRDAKEVDKYINDSYCGFVPKASMFRDMMVGVTFDTNSKNIAKMNKDIPVLFISGGDDPVGEKGKGVRRAYNAFKKVDVKDITMKIYPGARHEILLETNHDEVFDDIINWISTKLDKKD